MSRKKMSQNLGQMKQSSKPGVCVQLFNQNADERRHMRSASSVEPLIILFHY